MNRIQCGTIFRPSEGEGYIYVCIVCRREFESGSLLEEHVILHYVKHLIIQNDENLTCKSAGNATGDDFNFISDFLLSPEVEAINLDLNDGLDGVDNRIEIIANDLLNNDLSTTGSEGDLPYSHTDERGTSDGSNVSYNSVKRILKILKTIFQILILCFSGNFFFFYF